MYQNNKCRHTCILRISSSSSSFHPNYLVSAIQWILCLQLVQSSAILSVKLRALRLLLRAWSNHVRRFFIPYIFIFYSIHPSSRHYRFYYAYFLDKLFLNRFLTDVNHLLRLSYAKYEGSLFWGIFYSRRKNNSTSFDLHEILTIKNGVSYVIDFTPWILHRNKRNPRVVAHITISLGHHGFRRVTFIWTIRLRKWMYFYVLAS